MSSSLVVHSFVAYWLFVRGSLFVRSKCAHSSSLIRSFFFFSLVVGSLFAVSLKRSLAVRFVVASKPWQSMAVRQYYSGISRAIRWWFFTSSFVVRL